MRRTESTRRLPQGAACSRRRPLRVPSRTPVLCRRSHVLRHLVRGRRRAASAAAGRAATTVPPTYPGEPAASPEAPAAERALVRTEDRADRLAARDLRDEVGDV